MGYIVYELLVGLAAATASEAPSDCIQDWHGASDDGDQLVHVPNCLFVPDARLLGSQGSGVYPARILCIRYHFQVRCGLGDLPDFLCQIQQAVLVAMSEPPCHIANVTF